MGFMIYISLYSFYNGKYKASKGRHDESSDDDDDDEDKRAAAEKRTNMIKAEFKKRKKVLFSEVLG